MSNPNHSEFLIDQLDHFIQTGDQSLVQSQIVENKDLAEEWAELQIAVLAIRESGLNDQVSAIRNEFKTGSSAQAKKPAGIVRTMYKNTLRVAASIIILLGAATVYKYATVNSVAFYRDHYTSYALSTSRGAENINPMEKAYRDKDWNAVINQFNTATDKNVKSMFLTAMASLELKNYGSAIDLFNQVLEKDKQSAESYFHDEAEYYLALSYLGDHQTGKAIELLKRIKADPNHLYYQPVNRMSWIDLRIIEYKGSK
ncbi:MAG: tol-pal system YbgF family protein [Chitinophagales bacterium]